MFNLSTSEEENLIDAMGVDLSSKKLKLKGPIGFESREKIIRVINDTLKNFGVSSNMAKISEVLLSIDEYQQSKNDYKIVLLDGISDFLNEMYMRNYSMTIFTSDRKLNALITFKNLKIDRYFNHIIGGDCISKPKPNPEGIHKCCEEVDIKEKHTAYVTDTKSDLLMAKRAGVSLKVGVLTGLGNKENLEFESDILCGNIEELYNYIL